MLVEFSGNFGDGGGEGEEIPAGNELVGLGVVVGFDEVPVACGVGMGDEVDWVGGGWLVDIIEAPIGGDEVEPAVVVEVAGGDALPPSGPGHEAEFTG